MKIPKDKMLSPVASRNPTLPNELNKYSSHSNRLKQILIETKKCFEDINVSGRFEGTQLITAELLREEEREVTAAIEFPPTVIIFGQNAYSKSRIVNELFNKKIFPPLALHTDVKLRMVRIFHGKTNTVSLTLPDDYDLVDNLEAYNGPWQTIPLADLELPDEGQLDCANGLAVMEVTQDHAMLRCGAQVVVSPSARGSFEEMVKQCTAKATPILVYGFTENVLSEDDVKELQDLSQATNYAPIFFVHVPPPGYRTVDTDPPDGAPKESSPLSSSLPSSQGHHLPKPSSHPHHPSTSHSQPQNKNTRDSHSSDSGPSAHHESSTIILNHPDNDGGCDYVPVPADSLPSPSSSSNVQHNNVSDNIFMVKDQLKHLGYLDDESSSSGSKHAHNMSIDSYMEIKNVYLDKFPDFSPKFTRFTKMALTACLVNASSVLNISHTRGLNMFIISAFDMARDMLITPKKLEFAKEKEEELYKSLMKISVSKLDEIKELISNTISVIGSCLIAEAGDFEFLGIEFDPYGGVGTARELQACTEQIREMVLSRLNHAVAGKLVSSVDILRDSYTGTLTRCLESLETLDRENPEGSKTTDALKQILNAAYTVEITVSSSSSFIKILLERMKQVVNVFMLMQSMPWKSSPTINSDWKRRVAQDMLSGLSEARLAKSISTQIKERLNKSHDAFMTALKHLEMRHTGRLDKIEEHRLKLRKVHAPRLAKLALESTSLRDVIMNGMPQIGREVGRGQYGVVYSCDTWGSCSPCAIKSVVPPDDKHWNDLALEFFYTKNIPNHDRIVMLRGSVIDYMYGGGTSPAVLLVMDRLQRDLYTAIKQGIDWISRLQVAIDVVEGLRYLHSQGLVHRDVKLKNVLLDKDNRGKITDLGFCKPEAMMSGSIVGTPIHMAPELFTGHYDNSVDVYAFGILFWYVCAGHVRLPNAFEQCANKDQLWQSVKKGLRPEQPVNTSEDCWCLMQGCWEGEPGRRPFFGDVEITLKAIHDKYKRKNERNSGSRDGRSSRSSGKSSRSSNSPRHSKQINPHRS